jgi:ferric-dicitrate binding protein FerR (iron transport regulator)
MNAQASQELDRLLNRLWLDSLTDDECHALQSLIADDPDAQRRYLETVHMQQSLNYLLAGGDANTERASTFLADESATRAPGEASSLKVGALRRKRLPFWSLAASVAFVAGAGIAIAAYRSWEGTFATADDLPRAVQPAIAAPAPFLQEGRLGKITGLSLDASTDGLLRSMQVGQELRCGEVVQLSSGFIRLQLFTGPEVLIEGPAEFSIIGEENVFLRSGRLAAKGGKRLLLQTPLLSADCKEAEISFEASDDDSASIYVAEGSVTLATTPQEHLESKKLQVLRAGEGVVVEPSNAPGGLRSAARGPLEQVLNEWSQVEARLSEYQRLVLDDHPLAYWPLYRVRKNSRVLDLTQHGHDGLSIGKWPASVSKTADDERGVYFNGESYIEPDHKPPIKLQDGFAVEAWAKPEGPAQYQTIFASRWVLDSHTPSQQCFGVTLYAGDTDRWEFWTGRGKYGEYWNVMETPQTIDRTAWTHIVGVFTPKEITSPGYLRGVAQVFVNGEQVLEDEHEASMTDFDWPARIGAAEYVPRYLTSWLFKGRLSDIAVYGAPLAPESIKRHYKLGKPTVSVKTSSASPSPLTLLASR